MPYTLPADLEARYGTAELAQLTARTAPVAGEVDAAAVQRALDDAQAEIDGYLAVRYPVPVVAPAARLTSITQEIARYRLWITAGGNAEDATAEVRAYRDAIAWLRDVAAGRAALPEAEPITPAGGSVAFDAPPRVFSRDTLAGF